jgi:hypothetical protein
VHYAEVTVENIGDLALVECEGRIVERDTAFQLRRAVITQDQAQTVVPELTEVNAIQDWGLDTLLYLQRWAQSHKVRLKLFNPSNLLLDRLKKGASLSDRSCYARPDDGSTASL